MTSSEIRQSFLNFFKSKRHTIVPSSSLMPDAPNLLFTNAGMNQFVPIFLGQQKSPYQPGRAADTQKCIRAGGKHNDLEDVGLDTYHHTFFEMLGNWSFGDYFKKEAIEWGWELVAGVWGFPKERLYATVYSPGERDPAAFDQEAYDIWAALFSNAGLDPKAQILTGGKKDNFWMMGETGPCGPCSEIHVDLTEKGDSRGAMVNQGSPLCIEIWNLVFIQFNANPDGTFSPLPARHIDTGMGFERVTAIMQCSRHFTDFSRPISNYETDVFGPLFERLEQLSGKRYGSTLPKPGSTGETEGERVDVAFRVIADHIRTLSFAVADGILPGNTDRNYVLRRILRRAVKYGRALGFHEPFFFKLVDVLAETMGDVFPEIRERKGFVQTTIKAEEESFNRTLDRGLELFREAVQKIEGRQELPGEFAFKLYDTYGFPLDLTELMAREAGLTVDTGGFKHLMEQQRQRARESRKKEVISISNIDVETPTEFTGYDASESQARVIEVADIKGAKAVVLDRSVCYAEMGGQVGDAGEISGGGQLWHVADTRKTGPVHLHILAEGDAPEPGADVVVRVDAARRAAIQRHHTVTHLFHWALHEVAGPEATQKGSYVGAEKLTFDFNAAPLTPRQVRDIEQLVNERVLENAVVSCAVMPHSEVKGRKDILQFFGDKYGDEVRVVQIGGMAGQLNGYSMELCGGTHARATGEIGLFRILAESAIAAGVRRVEAVAGMPGYQEAVASAEQVRQLASKLNAPVTDLEKKIDALLAHQKELEKRLKNFQQTQAVDRARSLVEKAEPLGGGHVIIHDLGEADGDALQAVADALKNRGFEGAVLLGGVMNGAASLVADVSPALSKKAPAGKWIQAIAPIIGGKGGGRAEQARGGGKEGSALGAALAEGRAWLKAALG